jgi:hypothetical protein
VSAADGRSFKGRGKRGLGGCASQEVGRATEDRIQRYRRVMLRLLHQAILSRPDRFASGSFKSGGERVV